MPTVSNTSPLLNLAIIDQLTLLRDQFGEIWIPPAVLEELRIDEDLPGSSVVREALGLGWLEVVEVEDQPFVLALQRNLDKGEAEAIALAVQVKARWTLLDEREGRKAAKALGLEVTGVLGVLLRAKHEGKLSSLRSAMEELREEAGFRIGAELYADILKKSEERSE